MFEHFTSRFPMTAGKPDVPRRADYSSMLAELAARFGGCTFARGLYRIHDQASAAEASQWVNDAYPEHQGKLSCFGFDWLGRQFALDPSRGSAPDYEVLMLEPGTGEALEVPVCFSEFHDRGLEEYYDACLAPDFFDEFIATQQRDLQFDECAGYKVPLFLGGEDSVANLELSDIGVYWPLMGQLRLAARHMPPGSRIAGINLHD